MEWIDIVNPLKELEKWLIQEITGIDDLDDWIKAFSDPATYVDNVTNPRDPSTPTHVTLDALMGLSEDGRDHPSLPASSNNFTALKNTIRSAKLVLLNADTLNILLHNYHVEPLYDEVNYPNFILGFMRSLDGSYQWRTSRPSDIPANGAWQQVHGLGMPIWTDCQARQLVFRKLFKDWQHEEQFPDGDDSRCCCSPVSITKPRLFQNVVDNITGAITWQEVSKISGCDIVTVAVDIINHQNKIQDFAYYLEIKSKDNNLLFGGDSLIFHRWSDGTAEPRTTNGVLPPHGVISLEVEGLITGNGFVSINAYLFAAMHFLDINRNPRIPTSTQFPNEVKSNGISCSVKTPVPPEKCPCLDVTPTFPTVMPPRPPDITNDNFPGGFIDGGSNVYIRGCDPPDGMAWLDVDGDSVPDPGQTKRPSLASEFGTIPTELGPSEEDNCVIFFNPNQEDSDVDGVGDVCDLFREKEYVLGWTEGKIIDIDFLIRLSYATEMLREQFPWLFPIPTLRPIPIPEPLPQPMSILNFTSTEDFSKISHGVKEAASLWVNNSISDEAFATVINSVLVGIPFSVTSANVLTEKLNTDENSLTFTLNALDEGNIRVSIPTMIFNAQTGDRDGRFQIMIDGKQTGYIEGKDASIRTLDISFPKGAYEIEIKGTQIGPKLSTLQLMYPMPIDGRITGDYNRDKMISELDALAALKMSVKLLDEDLILDMDKDKDGKVTLKDAQIILKSSVME